MKKIIGVAAVAAILATGAATSALAQCGTGVMIKFDADAFAYETSYVNATYHSNPGSTLSMVGIVDLFCAPFLDLDPNDPTTEYTFYITGLTSAGTVVSLNGPTTNYSTSYSGGTWEIHAGSPRNAPTAAGMPALPSAQVPGNFTDGPVILSGTLSGFNTNISVTVVGPTTITNGSFLASYVTTGGTLQGRVGSGSAAFQGNWCPTMQPTGCTPATYSAHPNGKWDTPGTTATLPNTWGRMKLLYR
jgi:hypothetical protein